MRLQIHVKHMGIRKRRPVNLKIGSRLSTKTWSKNKKKTGTTYNNVLLRFSWKWLALSGHVGTGNRDWDRRASIWLHSSDIPAGDAISSTGFDSPSLFHSNERNLSVILTLSRYAVIYSTDEVEFFLYWHVRTNIKLR